MKWLEQQPDMSGQPEMGDTSALNLQEMLKVNHIVPEGRTSVWGTIFSVSEPSGSIGIASTRANPTLSVIYPGTNKPHLMLSKDNKYTAALFRTIADQEYLASASIDGICLWNLANDTSKIVYKFKEQKDWHLCVMDDRTVACVAKQPPSDGLIHIHILKTDAEMWTLSSTLFVKANNWVSDISYAKTSDDTACFLLCYGFNRLIQCLEMVRGRERWQGDEKQMGNLFHPWSICTDGSTVFVVDPIQHQLHLLSVDDGSVLRSIDLLPFNIFLPSCVWVQGDFLYIGHENVKTDTYCISKFTKPTEV